MAQLVTEAAQGGDAEACICGSRGKFAIGLDGTSGNICPQCLVKLARQLMQ